jgi:hypothetical protein
MLECPLWSRTYAAVFTIRDQLAREVAEVVESCSDHSSAFYERPPNACFEVIRVDEPWQSPGKTNAVSALPIFRSARGFITLSVAAIPRSALRVFGGPRYHSHL